MSAYFSYVVACVLGGLRSFAAYEWRCPRLFIVGGMRIRGFEIMCGVRAVFKNVLFAALVARTCYT